MNGFLFINCNFLRNSSCTVHDRVTIYFNKKIKIKNTRRYLLRIVAELGALLV